MRISVLRIVVKCGCLYDGKEMKNAFFLMKTFLANKSPKNSIF